MVVGIFRKLQGKRADLKGKKVCAKIKNHLGGSATAESHFYFSGNWGRWLFPISSRFDRLITSWKGKKKGKRKEEELDQKIPPPPPLWFQQQGEKEQSTTSISPALLARFSKKDFFAFYPKFCAKFKSFFFEFRDKSNSNGFFPIRCRCCLAVYLYPGRAMLHVLLRMEREKKGKESQLRWFIPSFMAFPPLSLHPPFSREKERRREACHYCKYLRQKIKINTAIS